MIAAAVTVDEIADERRFYRPRARDRENAKDVAARRSTEILADREKEQP